MAAGIDYNNKTFRSVSNSDNGEISSQTIFHYHQDGSKFWGEYEGGGITKGSIVGRVHQDTGVLEFRYHHTNDADVIRMGECTSTPEVMPDGRIRLNEEWQWLDEDRSKGISVVEEVKEPHE